MNFRFWVEFWCLSSAMYVVKMLWKKQIVPGQTVLLWVSWPYLFATCVCVQGKRQNCKCLGYFSVYMYHHTSAHIYSYDNKLHEYTYTYKNIYIYIYNQPHSFSIFWHQEGTGGTSHIECPVPQLYSFLGQKIVESFDTSHIECPVPPLCPVQLYLLHSFISSWAKKI